MNTRTKKSNIQIIVVGLIALILVGLYFYNNQKPKETIVEIPTIKLAIDKGAIVSALPLIANEKEYWKEEGVNVEILSFTSGRDAAQALLGGGADAATMADYPFMVSTHRDSTLRIVSSISTSAHVIQLIASKTSGIEQLSDLKNKRIGVTVGSAGQFYLDELLSKHGIQLSDYKRISLPPPEMVAAFSRGDLDAITTWQPHLYNALKAVDDEAISFVDENVYVLSFNIATRSSFIERNSDAVIKLLKGLRRAERFIKSNYEEALSIVASETGTEFSLVEAIWDEYSFDLTITEHLINALKRQEVWAIKEQILDEGTPLKDWSNYINDSVLNEINDNMDTTQ